MKFSYRVFEVGQDRMVAVCDREILGKEFSGDGLSIEVSKEFYSGSEGGENDVLPLVKKSTVANVIGEDIVSLLVKKGLVDQKYILKIGGVPHAQIMSVE